MLPAAVLAVPAAQEWRTYGHDYGDSRYSPLSDITPANVAGLKPVWTYHMRPPDRAARGFASSENTPIVVDGIMYVSTPYGRVVALDAESGKQIWAYQVPAQRSARDARRFLIGPAIPKADRRSCSAPVPGF